MSNGSKWHEIISADDDMISGELLDWSGLREVWDRWNMDNHFDFLREVEDLCNHMEVSREEWGGDFPGHSGTWHTIGTDDETALREELRHALATLLWENRRMIRP